jgi:uncharacterized protein YbaP (TraB family)
MSRFTDRSVRLVANAQRLFRGAALGGLGALALSGAALAAPPVWHLEEPGGGKITMFGSVHLLSDATQWRNPALSADLAGAGAVWFEIPIDATAQAEAGQLALQKGLLPQGQVLSAVLPHDLYVRTLAVAEREGLPEASLQRMRPWMAELTLSLLYFQKQGARSDLGVEEQLSASAPHGAERGAFETVAGQIDLFAYDPLPEQIASLRETLDELDTDPDIFGRLARAWADGDVKRIEHEALEPMKREDAALYDRLIVARNRRFAARIAQLAQQGRNVFVVVGVGHLVGPDGVPALLRQDGFKVEGP